MKYLKSFEKITVDTLLDKISKSGMNSLTHHEKDFLYKYSNNEPTEDVQLEMNSEKYTDMIGPYEATLILYDVVYDGEETQKRNGKLFVNDVEYEGYILFNGDDYIRGIFDSKDSDIYTDLEGLEYEIDNFLEDIFYESLNEKLILEGRIDDIEERFYKKMEPEIVDYFRKQDPTDNKSYFEWLCSRYSKLDKFPKDIEKTMIKMVKKYQSIKKNLNDNKIEQIKSVSDLGKIIDEYKSWDVLKGFSDDAVKIHHDDYEWIIFTPYEEYVSEVYGDKSWCTVYNAREHFSSHFGHKGALTYCVNKLNESENFAIEQTIVENGKRKCTVWDHKDHNILKDTFLVNVVEKLTNISYFHREKTPLLMDVWSNIVDDMPYPEMTEALLKPLFEKLIKDKGIIWCANQFGTYVIFDVIDESSSFHELRDFINNKLKDTIIKNPKKYIDDKVFYWTIMDDFFKESNDIIESVPLEEHTEIEIMSNIGVVKVIDLFPKNKLENLIEMYIIRLYGFGNIDDKIHVIYDIDTRETLENVGNDLVKMMEDIMPWDSLADSLIYELSEEDLREIIED